MKKIKINANMNSNLCEDLLIKILCKKYSQCEFYIYGPKIYKETFKDIPNIKLYEIDSFKNKMLINFKNLIGQEDYLMEKDLEKVDAVINIGNYLFKKEDIKIKKLSKRKRNKPHITVPAYLLNSTYEGKDSKYYKQEFKNYSDICFKDNKSYDGFEEVPTVRKASDILFDLESYKITDIFNKNNKITGDDLEEYVDEIILSDEKIFEEEEKINFIEEGKYISDSENIDGMVEEEILEEILVQEEPLNDEKETIIEETNIEFNESINDIEDKEVDEEILGTYQCIEGSIKKECEEEDINKEIEETLKNTDKNNISTKINMQESLEIKDRTDSKGENKIENIEDKDNEVIEEKIIEDKEKIKEKNSIGYRVRRTIDYLRKITRRKNKLLEKDDDIKVYEYKNSKKDNLLLLNTEIDESKENKLNITKDMELKGENIKEQLKEINEVSNEQGISNNEIIINLDEEIESKTLNEETEEIHDNTIRKKEEKENIPIDYDLDDEMLSNISQLTDLKLNNDESIIKVFMEEELHNEGEDRRKDVDESIKVGESIKEEPLEKDEDISNNYEEIEMKDDEYEKEEFEISNDLQSLGYVKVISVESKVEEGIESTSKFTKISREDELENVENKKELINKKEIHEEYVDKMEKENIKELHETVEECIEKEENMLNEAKSLVDDLDSTVEMDSIEDTVILNEEINTINLEEEHIEENEEIDNSIEEIRNKMIFTSCNDLKGKNNNKEIILWKRKDSKGVNDNHINFEIFKYCDKDEEIEISCG